jgi:peptide/nickel transport system permease protein
MGGGRASCEKRSRAAVQFLSPGQIVLRSLVQVWPVWASLVVVLGLSVAYRRKLGLYGHVVQSGVGFAGLFLVLFWLFTAVFGKAIVLFDPLGQIAEMKDALPGAIDPHSGLPYLFGGDKLARDVFGRVVAGARIVLIIAPLATLLALSVGISLGLPAGYFGRRVDALLSFLANLVLAFPIILLFYLLVSPGILETPIPYTLAGVFFTVPIVLFSVLFVSGYRTQPTQLAARLALTFIAGAWLFATFVFDADPFGILRVSPSTLNIFVAVALASGPGIFRIVRSLAMDIKTREYVLAAQTRGESPWYVMLWEILPNARGPLIVDACLRIGYTTILLGALGYFGLGMPPESPDWGTMIKESSPFMRIFWHPALAPALAMMSFVLGLNLLADAIREQSLRD